MDMSLFSNLGLSLFLAMGTIRDYIINDRVNVPAILEI